ncbi:MAG: MFS transporter [Actinomycetota bacterium]|nr:MFS transporter [Actinomycetota bacterium]
MSRKTSWLVLAAVGAGTFMSALDSSIVNVVLPVMRTSLGAGVAQIQWVVTVYLLTVSGTLLGFGRLGDLKGHKTVYMWGFGFFVGGSVACAVSRDVALLSTFRGVQAFGAAMLFANSPAILTACYPPEQRGKVLGLQATLTYLGLTVGPPLGGWLAGAFEWPSIFLVNVPIGLAAMWLSWRFIPASESRGVRERFDVAGAGTFLVGLVLLLLALNRGSDWGWASPRTLAALGAAAALLVGFVAIERRSAHPMLDLSLFASRTFSGTTLSALLNYITVYTVVFITPFYLIQGRGLTAQRAGLLLAVQSIVMAVIAPISGTLSDRIGSRKPAVTGMVVLAGAMAWMASLGADAPLVQVAAALALVGLGTGIFISPNNSALMGAVPRTRLGIASGVLVEARNVGMVLGVGLAGAVLTTVLGGLEPGPHAAFFAAVRASYLAAAGVAIIGAATSALTEPGA